MENCIFCKVAGGEAQSWKVCEDEHTYAFLDINPVNRYHALVIPKRHYENIFDIPEDEALHLMKAIKRVANLYKERLSLKNVLIVNTSGAKESHGIKHIHFHVVPRFMEDEQGMEWIINREWRERFDDFLKTIKE